MKQLLIKSGNAVIEEVPAPCVEPGMLLIRTHSSCISVGTEMSSVRNTSKPLWKRAVENPEEVKKALRMMSGQGVRRTRRVVEGRLGAGNAVGYSASGMVLDVGRGVDGFRPGDRVACAGTGYAYHAEIITVPPNLTVKVPESMDLLHASTVALGSIALQGVRRACPTLGERFGVIGLGILGQLTTQLLISNGCSVIGMDVDSTRGEIALGLGMDRFISSTEEDAVEQVLRLTDGQGADGVIITASSPSNDIVSQGFRMCRRKGRVVLVGDVGLALRRRDFYENEIDFLISTSYGPGRYDAGYEEAGLDYPFGYVRWTEKRNMEAYIRLLARGSVKLAPLIHKIVPIDQASEYYEMLNISKATPPIALLKYPDLKGETRNPLVRIVRNQVTTRTPANDVVRLALIGAGGFAKGMHLPNIQAMSKLFRLKAVISRSGHNAKSTAAQYNAEYSGTDYHDVLMDPEVDAILIATRHNLHASLVLEALKAGKHVFVEKPLALKLEDLEKIGAFFNQRDEEETPILLTGFNRRFSPHIKVAAEEVKKRTNPVIINYRMNAGYVPLSHWVHTEEGGGRNLGEACHIYDLFTHLTGADVVEVEAFPIAPATGHYSARDNFISVIRFKDGSVASLTYTALGSRRYPKELMEIYMDGEVIYLSDYKKTESYGTTSNAFKTRMCEKGQKEELIAFGNAILNGGDWPIPLWQQIQAMKIALQVERDLTGQVRTHGGSFSQEW